MVAFNFKSQWASLVEDGIKRQTVRESLRARPGDTLQHYTGQRTKACRKLRTDTECVETVALTHCGYRFRLSERSGYFAPLVTAAVEGWEVPALCFALLDGFGPDVVAVHNFFRQGGGLWLYRWEVAVRADRAQTWFYVYAREDWAASVWDDAGLWRAASGRAYSLRSVDATKPFGGNGAVGLMRGIPADWVEVV